VGGTHTITPTTSLPTITDAVVIDGSTEPDYVVGRPVIEIDGSLTGSGVHGLVLAPGSGGSTIRGLAINGFNSNDGFGLYLQTGSDNNLIAGNVIGLDADGTTAVSVMNNFGIYVASSGNLIGGTTAAARNVLSNNINAGIGLWGSNNVVIGNYIGTDATGTLDRGNAPTAWTYSAAATTVSAGSRRPSATSSPATTATASRSPTTCPAPWSRATTSAPTRAAPSRWATASAASGSAAAPPA
jgi:hypothetical protein